MYVLRIFIMGLFVALVPMTSEVLAKSLSASEIRNEMLGRTILTRRFGMKITMRYWPNGRVSVKALLGSTDGTWRTKGNQICSTFPSGPAKGTSCVSFTRVGPKQYKSSQGVRFTVAD